MVDNNVKLVTVCPKCGGFDGGIICLNCDSRKVKTEYATEEWWEIYEASTGTHGNPELLKDLKNELREKYVFNSPQFDKELYQKYLMISDFPSRWNELTDEEIELYYEYEDKRTAYRNRISSSASQEPKCPKCGSTKIQLVPRKWTPIMGIFTNKVDRICMNCKKKF